MLSDIISANPVLAVPRIDANEYLEYGHPLYQDIHFGKLLVLCNQACTIHLPNCLSDCLHPAETSRIHRWHRLKEVHWYLILSVEFLSDRKYSCKSYYLILTRDH